MPMPLNRSTADVPIADLIRARASEPPGNAGGDEVIGERGIAAKIEPKIFRNFNVGKILVGVTMNGHRACDREIETAVRNGQTRLDIKRVAGVTSAMAV